MSLRSRRQSRQEFKRDPLGLAEVDPWLDAITPPADEDTDPGGADLAPPDALPAGGHPTAQTLYGDGVSRCLVAGCGTPTTGLVCVDCTKAGRLPPDVDVYVPPFMERILPDPPLHLPPRSTFASCADPDDDTRERVRAYLSVRTHPDPPIQPPEDHCFDGRYHRSLPKSPGICVGCGESIHLPPRLDGAGYVLEPLPDVADFDEARDRLRADVIDRIEADGAA